MARPPSNPKRPEVYRRPAGATSPVPILPVPSGQFSASPSMAAAARPTVPGKPVLAEQKPPPTLPGVRFGPELPRPHLFPRSAVERTSLPPFGISVDLPGLDAVADDDLPAAVARALDETEPAPRELIRRIGQARGAAFLRARYAKTLQIEARGGLRLITHGRRRTPGGCFFVQCRDRMTLEAFETLASLACLAVGLVPRPSEPPPAP